MSDEEPLLSVENLQKYYYEQDAWLDRLLGRDPRAVQAVDGISFEIAQGETLGLVGESGCGKSTAGETVLNLRSPTGGTVRFDGQEVSDLDDRSAFRRRTGIVFQDPLSSLDPRMTAARIIREPLAVHGVGDEGQRSQRVDELLERVGLSADQRDRYPHEFSGGQQQRIAIARALALEPDFLVLDEPVSALDVSVQAQILNLLAELREDLGLTYLFIAHDLSVVRHISDRVAVMYLGELVEVGPVEEIFESPKHPYTEALLESVPRAEVAEYDREVDVLEGDVPSPRDPPSGCRFRTRCPEVIPPADLDVDQASFRAIMDLRDRIERGEVPYERARERADGTSADEVGAELRALLVDVELSGDDREAVDAAIDRLAAGESARARSTVAELRELVGQSDGGWSQTLSALIERTDERAAAEAAAAATLRERFESVCERDEPELGDGDHPVACHLY